MAATAQSDAKSSTQLPVLLDEFPAETYAVREIGAGFTAQSVTGDAADTCAETAVSMMTEVRSQAYSTASSDSGAAVDEREQFHVEDLPRTGEEGANEKVGVRTIRVSRRL